MIVPSMSLTEIKQEIEKDYDELGLLISKRLKNSKAKKKIKNHSGSKSEMHLKFVFKNITTKRKNTYIIKYDKFHKADILSGYCIYEGQNGKRVVNFIGGKFNEFTSHFFDRYKERYLTPHKIKDNKIDHFIANNEITFTTARTFGDIVLNDLMNITYTGVALGVKLSDNIFRWNTFISFNEMKKEQLDGVIGSMLHYDKEYISNPKQNRTNIDHARNKKLLADCKTVILTMKAKLLEYQ